MAQRTGDVAISFRITHNQKKKSWEETNLDPKKGYYMAVLLIGFDLNREGANYSRKHQNLTEYIEATYDGWWHHLDSTYLIVSYDTALNVANDLLRFLDRNDELLVTRVTTDTAWGPGFSNAAQEWLANHLHL